MTPEEINIAIAEAMGKPLYPWDHYYSDLNAVREAREALISTAKLRESFLSWLGWEDDYSATVFACVHATAEQQCEALLRVLGKWKD